VRGYYDLVHAFLTHAVAEGFLRAEHEALITISADFATLLERLRSFEPPPEKWLDRSDR